MSLVEFADKYGLVMEVKERRDWRWQDKYFAYFKDVEVKTLRGMLSGTYGNGADEYDAICSYVREISEKRLVHKAYQKERQDIEAPKLTFNINDYKKLKEQPENRKDE